MSKDGMWEFDRTDFKEATTMLLLNDIKEKNENDLELKKLIRLQFQTNTEMLEWVADLFEKVCKLHVVYLATNSTFRNQKICQLRITRIHLIFHLLLLNKNLFHLLFPIPRSRTPLLHFHLEPPNENTVKLENLK